MKSHTKAMLAVSAIAFAIGTSTAVSFSTPVQAAIATPTFNAAFLACPSRYHKVIWYAQGTNWVGCAPGGGPPEVLPDGSPPPGTIDIQRLVIPPLPW